MAPYSTKQKKHLYSHLTFPMDVSADLKGRLKDLIAGFNAGDQPPPTTLTAEVHKNTQAAPAATTAVASAQPAGEATKPADGQKPAEESPKAASGTNKTFGATSGASSSIFGAPRFEKYSFPEGRFRVALPTTPTTSWGSHLGLRAVEYSVDGVQGTMKMSYLLMQRPIDPASIPSLYDRLAASLLQAVNGANARQTVTTLNSSQGRQIDAGEIKGKAGCGALIRCYAVGRYIYIIGAVGNKPWLQSPSVNEFLNSLEFQSEREQLTGIPSDRDSRESIARHVREAEQAQRQQESEAKGYRFGADVRKALSGNGVGGQGRQWGH
jgi:hypothetical protein